MPKSKSTRGKAYTPKAVGFRRPPPPELIKEIEQTLERVETGFLLKLRQGLCSLADFQDARDVLNIVAYILCRRAKAFIGPRQTLETITQAGRITKALADRVTAGKSAVAHGEDYGLLLETLEVCVNFCTEELAIAPGMFVDDFNASKVITAGRKSAEIAVSKKIIDWAYGVAIQVSRMSYRQQAVFWNEIEQKGIPWGARMNFEQLRRRL